jgi:hypothetical protein
MGRDFILNGDVSLLCRIACLDFADEIYLSDFRYVRDPRKFRLSC